MLNTGVPLVLSRKCWSMLGSRILVVGGDSEAGKVIEVAPALNVRPVATTVVDSVLRGNH